MRRGWRHKQTKRLFLSNLTTLISRKLSPHRDLKCPPTTVPLRPPGGGLMPLSQSHVPLRDTLRCGWTVRISQARPSAGSRRRDAQRSAEETDTEVRSAPSAAQETRTWLHLRRTGRKEMLQTGINRKASASRVSYRKVKTKCAVASSVCQRRHAQRAAAPLSARLWSSVLGRISCIRWDSRSALTCHSPTLTKYCILNEYNYEGFF